MLSAVAGCAGALRSQIAAVVTCVAVPIPVLGDETCRPRKVFHVPGAPLELRWAWGPKHDYAFTATALTSKLWLIYQREDDEWAAKEIGTVGPEGGVLPVDISLSSDDKTLFVDCFGDGMCRVYDVSDPHHPKLKLERKIGRQVNMVSQSWDGQRLYFTTSLLANWDKTGEDNDQFLKGYTWDGEEMHPKFEIDFKEATIFRFSRTRRTAPCLEPTRSRSNCTS